MLPGTAGCAVCIERPDLGEMSMLKPESRQCAIPGTEQETSWGVRLRILTATPILFK